MRSIDSHALLPEKPRFPWKRYVLDTLLALLGSMGITAVIYFNHLYPRIPHSATDNRFSVNSGE